MTTRDIFVMMLNEFSYTGECYAGTCERCKYNTVCNMIDISILMLFKGDY